MISPTVSDVDKLPIDELFSEKEIREKREKMKVFIRKFVDKCYKAKYGDGF